MTKPKPDLRLLILALIVVAAQTMWAQTFSMLLSFKGSPNGENPSGITWDPVSRTLYGVTFTGGDHAGGGTVFRLDTKGHETVLHRFKGPETENSSGTVLRDAAGNLYGCTTGAGGNYQGAVFRLDSHSKLAVLHNFTGNRNDGANTTDCGLVRDSSGNLYGTTSNGGTNNAGTIFKINSRGRFSTIYSFCPKWPDCTN